MGNTLRNSPQYQLQNNDNDASAAEPARELSLLEQARFYFGSNLIFHDDPQEDQVLGFDPSDEAPRRVIETSSSLFPLLNSQLERAITVNSLVHLKKESLSYDPVTQKLSFQFDSLSNGTIQLFLHVKEKELDSTPCFNSFPFISGINQSFSQTLKFRDTDPKTGEESEPVYFIVVRLVARHPGSQTDIHQFTEKDVSSVFLNEQLTFLSMDSNDNKAVIKKQLVMIKDQPYVVYDIFGVDHIATSSVEECVICLSSPKDVVIIPCRHLCICSQCAQVLRFQSNKCPVCRCDARAMLKINIEPEEVVDEDSTSKSSVETKDETELVDLLESSKSNDE